MLWSYCNHPSDYLKMQIMDQFGPSEVSEASQFIACSKQIDCPESLHSLSMCYKTENTLYCSLMARIHLTPEYQFQIYRISWRQLSVAANEWLVCPYLRKRFLCSLGGRFTEFSMPQ